MEVHLASLSLSRIKCVYSINYTYVEWLWYKCTHFKPHFAGWWLIFYVLFHYSTDNLNYLLTSFTISYPCDLATFRASRIPPGISTAHSLTKWSPLVETTWQSSSVNKVLEIQRFIIFETLKYNWDKVRRTRSPSCLVPLW